MGALKGYPPYTGLCRTALACLAYHSRFALSPPPCNSIQFNSSLARVGERNVQARRRTPRTTRRSLRTTTSCPPPSAPSAQLRKRSTAPRCVAVGLMNLNLSAGFSRYSPSMHPTGRTRTSAQERTRGQRLHLLTRPRAGVIWRTRRAQDVWSRSVAPVHLN